MGNYVVKIFVEGGLEASLYGLGTEVLDLIGILFSYHLLYRSNFNIVSFYS